MKKYETNEFHSKVKNFLSTHKCTECYVWFNRDGSMGLKCILSDKPTKDPEYYCVKFNGDYDNVINLAINEIKSLKRYFKEVMV